LKQRTEEHRRHLSEALKGRKRTPEALAKFRKSFKKRWADPEFKKKMHEAMKGHFVSEETKRKLSKVHVSISQEQEKQIIEFYQNGYTANEIKTKLKLTSCSIIYSCLRRNNIKRRRSGIRNGHIPWNKNLKYSEEQKSKLNLKGLSLGHGWNKGIPANREHLEKLMGGLHRWVKNNHYPNWKGGISFDPYPPEFNDRLKYKIRKRDNFTCQFPGCQTKENGRAHDCHHINYQKNDNEETNLITLCYKCHMKTNGNRDYWMNYFQEYLSNKEK